MGSFDADFFAELAHELHAGEGIEETVEVLLASAPALVGCDFAGVLSRAAAIEQISATSPLAEKAAQVEIEYNEGPSLEAITQAKVVLEGALFRDRWPRWALTAQSLNVGTVLAVRLWTADMSLGALTLYSHAKDAFDDDAVGVAEVLARHASIALATARHEETLSRAADSRKVIGQAQGILMERFGLDDNKAFEVLRRYSNHTNTKLVDIARSLVRTRTLPDLSR